MAKRRRYHETDRPYLVTTVVLRRQPVFNDPGAADLLRGVIDSCRQRYGFLVLGFVIMPDHFHAVIVPEPGDDISCIMRHVKGTFARLYNVVHGTTGTVWQPRFHDAGIRTQTELPARVRYVEEIPVRAGLAAEPADYPYSSAGPYRESNLAEFLGTDEDSGPG